MFVDGEAGDDQAAAGADEGGELAGVPRQQCSGQVGGDDVGRCQAGLGQVANVRLDDRLFVGLFTGYRLDQGASASFHQVTASG